MAGVSPWFTNQFGSPTIQTPEIQQDYPFPGRVPKGRRLGQAGFYPGPAPAYNFQSQADKIGNQIAKAQLKLLQEQLKKMRNPPRGNMYERQAQQAQAQMMGEQLKEQQARAKLLQQQAAARGNVMGEAMRGDPNAPRGFRDYNRATTMRALGGNPFASGGSASMGPMTEGATGDSYARQMMRARQAMDFARQAAMAQPGGRFQQVRGAGWQDYGAPNEFSPQMQGYQDTSQLLQLPGAKLQGHKKGTVPGTVPKTGPALVHKNEIIVSADQVDSPLLSFLIRDKQRKMESGQMDGKGTGPGGDIPNPHYKHGTVPKYQAGSYGPAIFGEGRTGPGYGQTPFVGPPQPGIPQPIMGETPPGMSPNPPPGGDLYVQLAMDINKQLDRLAPETPRLPMDRIASPEEIEAAEQAASKGYQEMFQESPGRAMMTAALGETFQNLGSPMEPPSAPEPETTEPPEAPSSAEGPWSGTGSKEDPFTVQGAPDPLEEGAGVRYDKPQIGQQWDAHQARAKADRVWKYLEDNHMMMSPEEFQMTQMRAKRLDQFADRAEKRVEKERETRTALQEADRESKRALNLMREQKKAEGRILATQQQVEQIMRTITALQEQMIVGSAKERQRAAGMATEYVMQLSELLGHPISEQEARRRALGMPRLSQEELAERTQDSLAPLVGPRK